MKISSNNSISFNANLKSPKLRFVQKDFFVSIQGYGKNNEWANVVKKTADEAVVLIRKKTNLESVLHKIVAGIKSANQIPLDLMKRIHTGILRTQRDGWNSKSDWQKCDFLVTEYVHNIKYGIYSSRLDEKIEKPLKNPFKDFELSKPVSDGDILEETHYIQHASKKCINNAFKYLDEIYTDFKIKFVEKDCHEEDMPEINKEIAKMRWILAHAMPWERGSDAIANVLMRAMYKAVGAKTYPLAKGVSLDLEAYCTELEDYQNNFATYFEKPPTIIE